jgi:uncharacterized membrane protein HdeD (DUF308 family)
MGARLWRVHDARDLSSNVDYGRWWVVLGGVASIIYGLLLLIAL